jgi:hypothetical protein
MFRKKSNIQLKLAGLCEFFHETQWFFEVFEIPRISGSLILNFFKHPEPVGITKIKYPQWVLQIFCCKSTLKRFFFPKCVASKCENHQKPYYCTF